MSRPLASQNSSWPRWLEVPLPGLVGLSLPGRAFTYSTASFSVFTGSEAGTTHTLGGEALGAPLQICIQVRIDREERRGHQQGIAIGRCVGHCFGADAGIAAGTR